MQSAGNACTSTSPHFSPQSQKIRSQSSQHPRGFRTSLSIRRHLRTHSCWGALLCDCQRLSTPFLGPAPGRQRARKIAVAPYPGPRNAGAGGAHGRGPASAAQDLPETAGQDASKTRPCVTATRDASTRGTSQHSLRGLRGDAATAMVASETNGYAGARTLTVCCRRNS